MSEVEDIFSFRKCEDKKDNGVKIIVDSREKNSMVLANLVELGANAKREKLEVGDYIVGDVVVERKTFSDLVGSFLSKRLFVQLNDLKKCDNCFLIVEGSVYSVKSKIHPNVIRGLLLSIILDYKIPIIYTEDEMDTARTLVLIPKKKKGDVSVRYSKGDIDIEERKRFVLEGFPEVGVVKANLLLERYSSLREIFNLGFEDLASVISEKSAERFVELLDDKSCGVFG